MDSRSEREKKREKELEEDRERNLGNEESDEQYSPPRGLIERLPSDQSTQRLEDTRNSIVPVKDSQENEKTTVTEDLAFAEEHRESMAEMRQKILNTLEVAINMGDKGFEVLIESSLFEDRMNSLNSYTHFSVSSGTKCFHAYRRVQASDLRTLVNSNLQASAQELRPYYDKRNPKALDQGIFDEICDAIHTDNDNVGRAKIDDTRYNDFNDDYNVDNVDEKVEDEEGEMASDYNLLLLPLSC
ncbi:Hypothetical predicted protein [Octopus vulgaris]|uniref:Uncharacterized protein n=1 Tax=Octopus vulgaris TaxID=6645 RepID=A0AA36B818_OCTVU|nr:Hypothetical predicted protein [Octopus vulgaris]